MKKLWLIYIVSLCLFSLSCRKNQGTTPITPPEGSIKLSELISKHDYYQPFSVVNDNADVISATLNGEPVDFAPGSFFEINENGFFSLVLNHKASKSAPDTILFTTKTTEREASEWGIRAWVPRTYPDTILGTENIECIYPRHFTDQMNIPFIFYIKDAGSIAPVYCSGVNSNSSSSFRIKRGVGSLNTSSSAFTDQATFTIGGKPYTASFTKFSSGPTDLGPLVNLPVEFVKNSFLRVSSDLTIAGTGSLYINEGTIIIIDEGVNINVNGSLTFEGTADNPILVTCSMSDKYWGGFITKVAAGKIKASYTIFCQSGYHSGGSYDWGHAGRQALFYTENSTLTLFNCYITDHIGQVFYPQNSVLDIKNILIQRVKTGGQVNTSSLSLKNSILTDFPDDNNVFRDNDNDALYLSASDAVIDNTTFMFATDDGLDSGNQEGGEVVVTNCRFDAIFHEGAALSSGGTVTKHHTFKNCVFTNCGQGLEMGFSSPNHSALADSCIFIRNGIGIRYGDNYDWSDVYGQMTVKNSFSLYNDNDIWNMVRKNWAPKIVNLKFENTTVSKLSVQYPDVPVLK